MLERVLLVLDLRLPCKCMWGLHGYATKRNTCQLPIQGPPCAVKFLICSCVFVCVLVCLGADKQTTNHTRAYPIPPSRIFSQCMLPWGSMHRMGGVDHACKTHAPCEGGDVVYMHGRKAMQINTRADKYFILWHISGRPHCTAVELPVSTAFALHEASSGSLDGSLLGKPRRHCSWEASRVSRNGCRWWQ